MNKGKIIIKFILYCIAFFQVQVFSSNSESANTDLPKTSITVQWNDFENMLNKKTDTVKIVPEVLAPVPIVYEKLLVSAELSDSFVNCSYSLKYKNVSNDDWSTRLLVPGSDYQKFTKVSVYKGDFVQFSDSGYVLLSQKSKSKNVRGVNCYWIQNSNMNRGVRTFDFAVPNVPQGFIEIKAPKDFENVLVDNCLLINKRIIGNDFIYKFSLPKSKQDVVVSYSPPVKIVEEKIEEKVVAVVKKEAKVTSFQEIALFTSNSNTFVLNNIRLTVVNAPITKIKLKMPENYSLLKVVGNGLKKWRIVDSSIIEILLTFELEGEYSIQCVGEMTENTKFEIPSFSVNSAMRESGIFAVAVEGNGEASFKIMENSIALPLSEFNKKSSSTLKSLIRKYNKDFESLAISGINYEVPFTAQYAVERHEYIDVEEAIADSGEIVTVLSEDGKVLTNVSYYLKHRNKQFLSFTLPDSCDLWNIKINGTDIPPFIGNDGSFRISLKRFSNTSSIQKLKIDVTYFKNEKTFDQNNTLTMTAPVPDVPVSKLSWSVYYPDKLKVLKSSGDFTTSKLTVLGKRNLRLNSSIQKHQYEKLKQVNRQQQTVQKNHIRTLTESPDYLYGEMLLVVDEIPELEIRFISGVTYNIIKAVIIIIIAGSIVIFAFLKLRRKIR